MHIIRSLRISSSLHKCRFTFWPTPVATLSQTSSRDVILRWARRSKTVWMGKEEEKFQMSCLFWRLDQVKESASVSDSWTQTQRLCEAGRRSHLHAGLLWSFRMAGALFSQRTVCLEDSTLGTLYGNLCYRPQEIPRRFWNSVQLSRQQKSNSINCSLD